LARERAGRKRFTAEIAERKTERRKGKDGERTEEAEKAEGGRAKFRRVPCEDRLRPAGSTLPKG
jgi:hypothetical protein